MANDTILTPGGDHYSEPEQPLINLEDFLQTGNCLSEFSENEKGVARENLGVYPKDSVYTKDESDIKLSEEIKKAFEKYMDQDDPQGIIPQVELMIKNFVRNDGTTPFIAPQVGVDPVKDNHLATKKYISQIIKLHLNDIDPHNILPEVKDILKSYVKESEIYSKSLLYTKNEIDLQSGKYIKKDGTTPFTKAQIGSDPLIDSHLSTKRYVDQSIYKHIVDVDPHNFISILNNRLAKYAKVKNVYDRTETYSRVLIDTIIRGLVQDAANDALLDHINQLDPHKVIDWIKKEGYVKLDGTVPFKNPQKGVDAVELDDLVTYRLLLENLPIWKTSGPVETTVGFVEDNTELPNELTLLEILDAIFYGKSISLDVPDYVNLGDSCDVTVCIHGSLALIDYAELYQDGELIYTFLKDDFENGCVTVPSNRIFKDSEFEFKVYYTNGVPDSVTKTVKCAIPLFVGSLPKWKFANTITYDYLKELKKEKFGKFKNLEGNNISYKYNFVDPKLRHPFIVVPVGYPNLETVVIKSLEFGIEAFDIIDRIPLKVPGAKSDIIFKIYVYRLALSSLTQKVTFNFETE